MHHNGLRETDGFSSQPLDTGSEREVFSFNLLGEYLHDSMCLLFDMAGVGTSFIGTETGDAKRR